MVVKKNVMFGLESTGHDSDDAEDIDEDITPYLEMMRKEWEDYEEYGE